MEQVTTAATSRRSAILAALIAGACWGVSFLAPRALAETAGTTIALFRFLFFGLSSLIALSVRRKSRPRISPRVGLEALGLSMAGFSLYYSLLALGVKGAGVTFPTAIIGLLPLTIMLVSTPIKHWVALRLPIALILLGGVLIPMELFGSGYSVVLLRSNSERVWGVLASVSALILWTAFAVLNARFLRRHSEWSPLDWSGVLGVASAATATGLFIVLNPEHRVGDFLRAAGDPRVLLWTGFMGIVGAWVAGALWNFASKVLPAAALGMLLIFESVFGLLFGFLYERRFPSLLEGGAAISLIAGAVFGIRMLYRVKPNDKWSSERSEAAG